MSKLPIEYRPIVPGDISFVINSWLKSYRSSPFAKHVTSTVYFANHHKIVSNLLQNAKVIIACNPSDISQIYGYICHEKVDEFPVIHYSYVKKTFRGMGIATALMTQVKTKEEVGLYTHYNNIVNKMSDDWNIVHHPYLVPNIKEEIK